MFALLPVFAWGVCAFLVLARLLGVVGQCGCVRPFAPACLLACSRSGVGVVGVCGGSALAPLRAGCNSMGRDNVVPPHTAWRAVPG